MIIATKSQGISDPTMKQMRYELLIWIKRLEFPRTKSCKL